MNQIQDHHQQFRKLLAQQKWDASQAFWLNLASTLADQPEFLLLLVKEFADAGKPESAAELAGLLASTLKTAGKQREWLFALKLQAGAKHPDRAVRAELIDAYTQTYHADPRLNTILTAAGFDDPKLSLPAAIIRADTLLALAEGSYCQHKSWGFGRVKTFDAVLNRVVIGFAHNPDHAMQLAYAAASLTPVNADHIETRKASDLPAVQQLVKEDPLHLLRIVLTSHGGGATAAQIEASLAGSVVPLADWKKWWTSVRNLAKRDAHYDVPARKIDRLMLRQAPISQQDELLEAFHDGVSLTQKTDVTEQLLKIISQIENKDLLLQEFQDGLTAAIQKSSPEKVANRLEAAFVLEDLLAHQTTPTETGSLLVSGILENARNLPTLLAELSGPSQKRAAIFLKKTHPERLLFHLNRLPGRVLDELDADLESVAEQIAQEVQNQTASRELLHWLGKNYHVASRPAWFDKISGPALLSAILNSIADSDNRTDSKRLRDLLLNDETLLTDLLSAGSTEVIRDHARQIMNSPAFELLDRRSLMARLVKEFPFVQELLVTKSTREQPLIVSKSSFRKRQAELEEIVQKKIPENSREIGVARSYGDLRENFEFKAAKDMQRLLMRQRAELEVMITRATPTDFADVRTDSVQIGTRVTVTNQTTGQQLTYHILGAWDGNPNRNILSYPAALAQAMLNKKTGDEVTVQEEAGTQKLQIDRIEKVPAEILNSL